MKTVPIRHVAEVWTSSVDKHTIEGELPVQLCNYTDAYKKDRVRPGPDLMRATATAGEIRKNRLRIGDSVFTKDSEDPNDIGISAFVDGEAEDFVCGYHLAIARPFPSTDGRFLNWALRSRPVLEHFGNHAAGISRYGIAIADLRSAPIPAVGLEEQRRIADFLDDRVSRIDRIIAARREQLGLVKVQFQSQLESLIWTSRETIRLKHLLVDVTSGPRGWGDLVTDHGTPFVRIGNLSPLGIEIREENMAQVAVPDGAEAARAALREGDVLLSITAAFGEAGVWREGSGTFSQHVARLRPVSTADADWIAWVLQTASLHDQYRLQAYGGTKIGMGLENVRNLEVPARSVSDRQRTLPRVREAWSLFANGGRQLQSSIDLLTEYKSSLITAAVTGELDVSTAGSSIPG